MIGAPFPRGMLRRIARAVGAQVEREEQARIMDHLAALDHGVPIAARGLMAPRPCRRSVATLAEDPLERLWRLPAWSREISG
jgi:hypothetical protein